LGVGADDTFSGCLYDIFKGSTDCSWNGWADIFGMGIVVDGELRVSEETPFVGSVSITAVIHVLIQTHDDPAMFFFEFYQQLFCLRHLLCR
jgi:hypothetical protein